MMPRISLCDDHAPRLSSTDTPSPSPCHKRTPSEPLLPGFDDPHAHPFLLDLGGEFETGQRVHCTGVDWEIVEHDDDRVARLIVR